MDTFSRVAGRYLPVVGAVSNWHGLFARYYPDLPSAAAGYRLTRTDSTCSLSYLLILIYVGTFASSLLLASCTGNVCMLWLNTKFTEKNTTKNDFRTRKANAGWQNIFVISYYRIQDAAQKSLFTRHHCVAHLYQRYRTKFRFYLRYKLPNRLKCIKSQYP